MQILSQEEYSLLNSYLTLFPSTASAQTLRDKFQETIESSELRPIQLLTRRNTSAFLINPFILDQMLKILKNREVQKIVESHFGYIEPTNNIVSSDLEEE
jgi:hypothetical protein